MAISTEVIRKITIQGSAPGVDQAIDSLNKLAAAQGNVAVVSDTSSKRALSAEAAWKKQTMSVDEGARAQAQFEKAAKVAQAALNQGIITASEHTARVELLRKKYLEVPPAVNENYNAFDRLGNMLTRRLIFGVIISHVKDAVTGIFNLNAELAKTADIAARLGTSGGGLQGLSFTAETKGIANFEDAMLQVRRQIDLSKAGLGDLLTLFKANGLSVGDVRDTLFKVSDLVKAASGDWEKQTSILQQAGLPNTREYVRLLEQGSDRLRKQSDDARKLTEEQLSQAKALDDKWNELWANFKRESKGSIVDFVSWIDKLDDRWARFHSDTLMPIFREMRAANTGSAPVIPVERQDLPPVGVAGTRITVTPPVDPARVKELLSLEQQRIGVLGQMATIEQQVRSVEIGIQLARLNHVNILPREEAALLALARAQALGVTQIRASVDAQQIENATFGMSAGNAAAYRAVWEKVYEAKRAGRPLDEAQIRTLQQEAEALKKVVDQNERLKQATQLAENFFQTLAQGLLNGKSLTDSLKASFDALASSLANAAVKDAIAALVTMDPAMAAKAGIEAAAAISAKLLGGAFDNSAEKELKKAQEAWAGMKSQMDEFIRAADGFDLSKFAQAIYQAKTTVDQLYIAAIKANDAAGADRVAMAFVHTIWNQMDQFARSAGPEKGEFAQQIEDQGRAADQLIQSMKDVGFYSEEAGNTIRFNLANQIQYLKEQASKSLTADINEASGKGFVNELNSLFDRVAQYRSDASITGVDTTLIDRFLQVQAQKIVDGAGLVGDSFGDLIKMFPNLTGLVHESTSALEDQAKAQKNLQTQLDTAARSIVDYVNSFKVGSDSTLSPTQRLTQSQATYGSQLSLAQANNPTALASITQYADAYIKSLKENFGSAASGQINSILQQLLNLPAVQTSTDPVVQALLNVQTAVQNVQTAVGGTTTAVGTNTQSTASLLSTTIVRLDTSISKLADTVNAMNSNVSLLTTIRDLTSSIQGLQSTATQQLQVMNAANTVGAITVGPGNVIALNNNMLTALNKIVYNTGATARNTEFGTVNGSWIFNASSYPPTFAQGGWITGGTPGRDSVQLASGGLGMPGEFVLRRDVAQANASWLSGFNQSGRVPSFGAANDNGLLGRILAELTSLRRENAALMEGQARAAREDTDRLIASHADDADTVATSIRQSRLAKRVA